MIKMLGLSWSFKLVRKEIQFNLFRKLVDIKIFHIRRNIMPKNWSHIGYSLFPSVFSDSCLIWDENQLDAHYCTRWQHRGVSSVTYDTISDLIRQFSPRDFVRMAFFLTTALEYGCSWAILFWARHAPNSEMKALKIVKKTIAWKK